MPTLAQALEWVDRHIRPAPLITGHLREAAAIERETEAFLLARLSVPHCTADGARGVRFDRTIRTLVECPDGWRITWRLIGAASLDFQVRYNGALSLDDADGPNVEHDDDVEPTDRETDGLGKPLWHTATVAHAVQGLWRVRTRLAAGLDQWAALARETLVVVDALAADPPALEQRRLDPAIRPTAETESTGVAQDRN
jgi:hypothetical protein